MMTHNHPYYYKCKSALLLLTSVLVAPVKAGCFVSYTPRTSWQSMTSHAESHSRRDMLAFVSLGDRMRQYQPYRNSRRYGYNEENDSFSFWHESDDSDEDDEDADLPAHNQMSEHLFEYPVFEDDEDDTWFSVVNPVGSDQFDLDELHERISEIVEGAPASISGEVSERLVEFIQRESVERKSKIDKPRPKDVHIILFCPDTDYEGVHTIEFPPGSGNNVLLAFECEKECKNFAEILRSQDFFDPSPEEMNLDALEEYCDGLGVHVQIVPRGTNLEPPTAVVKELTHNPELISKRASLEELYLNHDVAVESGVDSHLEFSSGAWE